MPISRASLLLVLALASVAPAAAPPRAVSFRTHVYPILVRHCLRCHQGSNPTSAVRLDARSELLGESNGRPLVVVGQAGKSRLLDAVSGKLLDKSMPPEGFGERLNAAQIETLRVWIDRGLDWDDTLFPKANPTHRFFRAVVRPPVPHVEDPRAANAIDAFLATAWKAKRLQPVGEASRRVLIRRATLDLVGLPPTPDQIDAFEADARPDAYARLVERLLADPRYGERWGRHWLDVARYADSEGYESNHSRAHAWRYRDWVVSAFNADLPFADFVKHQLAGDEVRPYSDENLIATGFLAAARLSSNEEDRPRQRNDILVDVVNTTATAFLGLTFNCAQCHNHKFDPITARDYYRMQAFFVRGQPGNLVLRDPELRKRWQASIPPEYEKAVARRNELFETARLRLVESAITALPEDERKALAIAPDKRDEKQERLARQVEVKIQFGTGQIEREIGRQGGKEYDALKKRLAEWEKTVPEEPQTFGFLAPATASTVRVLPMKGFYPLHFEPAQMAKRRSHLLIGGDVHQRGPALDPGWPALFGETPAKLSPTPRQALASWISDPAHPLAARVWVNRLWQHHFGRGLVVTSGDFGVKGSPPSHPELLDWLASEFLRTGSTKHLHRLIVQSAAYRLASTPNGDNAALDPDNVYLWRWSPRRLEAEVIRDSLLATAGELDSRQGGPADAEETTSRRRAFYLLQRRDQPPMIQGLFDGPSASAESCTRRSVSTVPLQSLYLLNNRFSRATAKALASRVTRIAGDDRDRQISTTFRLALGRLPDEDERQACRRFFARHGQGETLAAFCQAVMNVNEFVYLE